MNRRVPFFAAVVGALLIGSATTGTTHASWTDQAPLQVNQVSSGALAFSASTPSGVNVKKTAGETGTSTITVADTSTGKNIRQRISASVASTPAGVTATVATTCGGSVSAVDTTPASGNQTFCVKVTSSTTAVSGTVVINLGGTQRPGGWTTPTVTRSVPVTVSTPIPAAPVLSCRNSYDNDLTWPATTGSYRVYSRGGNGAWSLYDTTGATSTSPNLGFIYESRQFRVAAVSGGVESEPSNTVRLERFWGSYYCEDSR